MIFCAALLVRSVYFISISTTACLAINLDPISDMEAFHRWGSGIAGGDWLDRAEFHPFHPWQESVAPREQWNEWYGHAFHQEPFYPYFIALIYLVAPRDPVWVILVQLLLGAAGCAITYLAARHLVSEGAARSAGILSVLYGPYLYYESLVLRDTLLVPLTALILLLLLETRSRDGHRHAGGWWILSGLAIGISMTIKASILPFALLIMAWAVIVSRRRGWKRAIPALLLAAGFALPPAVVVARNIAVSAAPLKLTTRGAIEFINGNNRHHIGIGWFDGNDDRVGEYARAVMSGAGGRLVPTVITVLGDWSDDPTGFLRLQAAKLGYFFAPYEMPNNASFAYFRQNSLLLRHGQITFFLVLPLALVGLLASWESRRRFVPVYLLLASGVTTTVIFYVISRFRIPFLPALLILSGLGAWSLRSSLVKQRWASLGGGVAVLVIALLVNAAVNKPDSTLIRPQDHMVAIQAYLDRGQEARALAEAEVARSRFPSLPHFHRAAGILYLAAGRDQEAAQALGRALALDPSDAEVRRMLERLTMQGVRP